MPTAGLRSLWRVTELRGFKRLISRLLPPQTRIRNESFSILELWMMVVKAEERRVLMCWQKKQCVHALGECMWSHIAGKVSVG